MGESKELSAHDLLAEYADTLSLAGMGAPKSRLKRGKAAPKPSNDSFIRPATIEGGSDKRSPIVTDEIREEGSLALRDLYELIRTDDKRIIDLLRKNNTATNKMLAVTTAWWEFEQDRFLKEKLKDKDYSGNLAELNEEARERINKERAERKMREELDDQDSSSSMDLESDTQDRRTRKRSRRTRNGNRRPRTNRTTRASNRMSRFGKFKQLMRGGGGKLAGLTALLAGGALTLESTGVTDLIPDSFTGTDDTSDKQTPTVEPIEKPVAKAAPVVSAPAEAAQVEKATAKSMAKSLVSKGGTAIKAVSSKLPIVGNAIATGMAVYDASEIVADDSISTKDKEKQLTTLATSTAGSMIGGTLGGALGSLLGPIGTVAGIAIGSAVGNVVGTALGEGINNIYDYEETQRQKDTMAARMAEIKEGVGSDGHAMSILPDSLIPYTERSYMYGQGSASNYSYSGIPSNIGETVTNVTVPTGTQNTPGLGVLSSLQNPKKDKRENNLSNWNNLFEEAGAAKGVDPRLLRALTKQESGGVNKLTSSAGAQGLTQLIPSTARELGVTDSNDPRQNIHGGALYLSKMLKKYDGNVPVALAAYNAGPGNIDKAIKIAGTTDPTAVMAALPQVRTKKGNQIDYKQTQEYVKNITGTYNEYLDQTNDANVVRGSKTPTVDATQVAPDVSNVSNLVERTNVSSDRVNLVSVPEVQQAAPAPAAVQSNAPVTPKQKEAPPMLARAGGQQGQNTRTSLDDMPMMIDTYGLAMLHLGGV